MKIGAVYPQIETGGDPDFLDKIGLATEELGYDSLVMYDHVVGAKHGDRDPPLTGPYTENDPFHDPFVAFAYLAGKTSRIEFITGILILPQRQTVLVAKQAADLDLVSRGRFSLGVGTGWNYVEYDALGADFAQRGKMLSEQVPYLRRLWSEPLVSFEGQFHTIDRGNIIPRPTRQIPILFGGFAPPAFRRAGRMGDGFIFPMSFEKVVKPGLAMIREVMDAEGRDFGQFAKHLLIQDRHGGGPDVPEVLEVLEIWRKMGGTHASISTMKRGHRTPEEHIEYLAEIRRGIDG